MAASLFRREYLDRRVIMRLLRSIPIQVHMAMLVGIGFRLYFWLYTGYTSDDALITLTHAANWANGDGPVPYPGVHVQGYTSPLALLVETGGEAAGLGGIVLLKALSLVLSGIAILFAWIISQQEPLKIGRWAGFLWCGLLAVHPGLVRQGMIGLEGSILMFTLLGVCLAWFAGRAYLLGMFAALLALSRPDAMLWLVPIFGVAVIQRRGAFVLKSALLAVALYAPWLIFSTVYYGSPVPQTVTAKSQVLLFEGLDPLFHWVTMVVGQPAEGFRQTPLRETVFIVVVLIPMSVSVLAGLVKVARRPQGAALTCAAIAYGVYVAVAGGRFTAWYYVPVWVWSSGFLAVGVHALWQWIGRVGVARLQYAIPLAGTALAAAYLVNSVGTADDFADAQSVTLDGYYKPVGLALRQMTPPKATIYLEPAGYIPYYSQRRALDYPGLIAPEVSGALRDLPSHRGFYTALPVVQPDYVVLRRYQLAEVRVQDDPVGAWFVDNYRLIHEFVDERIPHRERFLMYQRILPRQP